MVFWFSCYKESLICLLFCISHGSFGLWNVTIIIFIESYPHSALIMVFGSFLMFIDEKVDIKVSEAVWQPEEHSSSSPERILSPFSQKYQACRANLQSTSKLTLSSEMVYSQELNLPEGVDIISIKPSAGLYVFWEETNRIL